MNNFNKLGLSAKVLEVLVEIGFERPTPVQEKSIPVLIDHDPIDFIGLAQTGTGKTAAFGLPLLDLIDPESKSTQALIMAPTRELGKQTASELKRFSSNQPKLNVEVVYGGSAITNQIRALKKPTQIVVATPGRLLDLIKRKAVKLEHVKYVVLDEADEMLNMGFKEDIDRILSYTPDDRVTWLFSATMPSEIRKIVKKYMIDPKEVSIITKEKVNKDIVHQYVMTKSANKIPALRRFLDLQPEMKGVMFCRTRKETQEIADELSGIGYNVEALHGDLSQAQRDSVMKRFKGRAMQLLIATDVAARGIDVDNLSHVIHHRLPDQLENYTHRSGRTARAGKSGISLAFINPREGRKISDLEKKNKIKFQQIEVPSLKELTETRMNHWASLIINTKVDKHADRIFKHLHGHFAHLSKEDLLKRLITTQLDHLSSQDAGDADLNEIHSNSIKGSKTGYHRYFINAGSIDGITKSDLIHFLSDVSGVKRKHIGNVSLQKTCSYFDVDDTKDKGFGRKFRGIEVDGRMIRVNRDDDGHTAKPRKKTRSKPGNKFSKKKKKRNNPRGHKKRRKA